MKKENGKTDERQKRVTVSAHIKTHAVFLGTRMIQLHVGCGVDVWNMA